MSFSTSTKSELCKLSGDEPCCHHALLAGIIFFAGRTSGAGTIVISTENASVSRLAYSLAKQLISEDVHTAIKKRGKLHLYTITINNCEEFLEDWWFSGVSRRINPDNIKRDCCKRTFIRGAFLGGGYITAPEKSYHLEIITRYQKLRDDFNQLLEHFEIAPKWSRRNGVFVFYFKGSEKISDILAIMGAHKSMMEFLNIKIVKEMRGNANRLVNCETANVDKSISASMAQIKAIRAVGVDDLPEKLRPVAKLRLDYPENSLKELGELCNPPLTKSAVNHIMRRIMEIYKKHDE